MITGKNYIGKSLSNKGENTFNSYNAAEFKMLENTFYCATEEEVNNAAELAKSAFENYKNLSGSKKADFLDAIAEEIINLGDELVKTAMTESALPEPRIVGERGRTVNQLKMFAQLLRDGSWIEATIDTAIPDRAPIPKSDLRKFRQAVGPVVVFGASNFPLAFSTAGGDTASALASGCPVIVKSHPSHPGTGELVASAIIKAAEKTNMPNGVFSFLNDSSYKVGTQLVTHPDLKSVAFTGSLTGGKALFDLANNRKEPIPVFAEMGSTNPVFILPKKIILEAESIATGLAGSITMGVGQFCTNPGLVIAIESEGLEMFINSLSSKIKESAPGKMLNKGIEQNYNSKRNEMLKAKGIRLEGNAEDIDGMGNPTVVSVSAEDFISNPDLHQEIFGPFSLIVKCKSITEMIFVAKQLEGQLTATLQAEAGELSEYSELINVIKDKVGRLIFNGFPTGVEVCASMNHGGPYPATTDSRFTSVGTDAIKRFTRPICYQDWPQNLLPDELKNENPLNIWRLVDNNFTKEKI
ncbi:MAG: aldehyde dehydrogenase (NADP(+)) [Melioribacteraceae bacterium]|nr:aldehyde dehydrogenase (NADP(+)) [Melioribacteraceae bacterium]